MNKVRLGIGVAAILAFSVGVWSWRLATRYDQPPMFTVTATEEELTPEEQAEFVDQEALAKGMVGSSNPDDPHNWPEWHSFRNKFSKDHPGCMWNGCSERGKFIHHGCPVSFVVEAGHPEMVYSVTNGQTFWAFCNEHHKQAHLIGVVEHGSYARTFDPNIAESARRGVSVGAWPFKDRSEAVKWIRSGAKHASKTTLAF